jgi:hypothetical protein
MGAMLTDLAYGLVPASTWGGGTTEMAQDTSYETLPVLKLDRPLGVLKSEHIRQIDDALSELGPFGEVRIIKQRGKLRFIQKVESMNIMEGAEK